MEYDNNFIQLSMAKFADNMLIIDERKALGVFRGRITNSSKLNSKPLSKSFYSTFFASIAHSLIVCDMTWKNEFSWLPKLIVQRNV